MRAGVLPAGTQIETADDSLVAMGHGIAHLMARPRAAAAGTADREPTDGELVAGVGPLWQRIALWRPAAVVFLSRRAAEVAAGRPLPVAWGVLDSVALAGRPCVLLPSPDVEDEIEAVGVALLRNLAASLPR